MSKDGRTFAEGARTVRAALLPDGTSPAAEFWDGLDAPAQAKLLAVFEELAKEGRVTNAERFRRIKSYGSGDVWEFKGGPWRMWGRWARNGVMLLLEGGKKPSDKVLKRTVERVDRLFEKVHEGSK